MLRKPLGLFTLLVALLLIAACAPQPATTGTADEATGAEVAEDDRYGGTLIWSDQDAVNDSLDQDKSNHTQSRMIARHVLETLVIVDPATGEIHPGLATSWEVSDDGLEITFQLREGVTFHDGSPFNAEAVKFNFDRTASLTPKAAWQYMGGDKYSETVVADEYTVKLVYNEPYAALFTYLSDGATGIDSPTAIEEFGDDYGVKHLVGTGPFKFAEWVQNSHVTLERNEEYNWAPEFYNHEGPAYLEKIVMQGIPELATRSAALEAGEIDLVRFGEQDVALFQDLEGFKVELIPKAGTTRYYLMNTARTPTDEMAVREAIIYAIDRQAIIDSPRFSGIGNIGLAALPSNMVPGGVDEFAASDRAFDPDKAMALLEEAGWVDSDGDGLRERDGESLHVTMVIPQNDLLFVQPAQAMLRDVGIDMEIQSGDFNAWIEAGTTGEFHLMTMSDSGYDGPSLLSNFFKSDGPYAFTKLQNDVLDEALALSGTTLDQTARFEHVKDAMRVINEEAAAVNVMELYYPYGMKESVQDPFFNEIGFPYLYDTWIQK
ncbi:MAG: ABC transporter substrate-binding protein [Chloroflexota bacterium]